MMIIFLQMNNIIATKEFNRLNVEKVKEQTIMEINELKQETHKTKSNVDDLVEKSKDLDPTYVKNNLKEYDDLV